MGENSGISWTHHTFSGWWGCVEVSEACRDCYARDTAERWGFDVWGADKPRRMFGDKHWNEPLKWNARAEKAGVRERVFFNSMADVFEDRRDLDEPRARMFALAEVTENLNWLLLTKRPDRILDLVPPTWRDRWPRNVWMGTTAENQARYDERILHLAKVPAPVRFLSMEPLLGHVDLGRENRARLDWLICGGESGPRPRPFDVAAARSLRDQCREAVVPFFMKQMGKRTVDGLVPLSFKGKGDKPAEWPDDLRIQEFPA